MLSIEWQFPNVLQPSSMACKPFIIVFVFLVSVSVKFHCSKSQKAWIQAGYWFSSSEIPISAIDSSLFTHVFCASAYINSSSYQLYIKSSNEKYFSTFTSTIKGKNPSVVSLLSIWAGGGDLIFSSMINESSYRRSFIESSIYMARLYSFGGLDLSGVVPSMSVNMTNLGIFFHEWREAADFESIKSGKRRLLLVMAAYHSPSLDSVTYPIDSLIRNLDWIHLVAYDYYVPINSNVTGAHAALYGDSNWVNTNSSIKEWFARGFSASKLVLGLPYHGFCWTLVNPDDNSIGAPTSGPAITPNGSMGYKSIKSFIRNYGFGAAAVYNSTYVVNFFTVGTTWINFDDVEAIKTKVSYAKQNKLAGYNVYQLSDDDNWVLSLAAQGKDEDQKKKEKLLTPIMAAVAVVFLFCCTMACCYFKRVVIRSTGIIDAVKRPLSTLKNKIYTAEKINTDSASLQVFSFATIKVATDNFSSQNKLGQGGFGPVYKGRLIKGKEIAVKRLSKISNQGAEEFKNEITLTAKLQHVNLVRLLGLCTEREEMMLIYEYMPNKSLDFYLYDPIRQKLLDWRKRVHIIEGITQGLLYLQEYSNVTIIHRDLKASNILLDEEMNPKISDFGMARPFSKDELEARTGKIVGTYGYIPPEYIRRGKYSRKYDVYSFGVLLLQIVSGKRNTCYYGSHENLNLLEYAYELWKDGKGLEFIEPSLDDSCSSCKLIRCMQVALLCVQENPMDRPTMLEVAFLLKSENAAIANPERPAFSVQKDEDEERKLGIKIYSVDYAPITEVVPR